MMHQRYGVRALQRSFSGVSVVLISLLLLLSVIATPVTAQGTTFDSGVLRWNTYSELAGGVRFDSPWMQVGVPLRTVIFSFMEVHARVTNRGPGAFAFDIYGEMRSTCPSFAILPQVWASQSYISQAVGIGWVNDGFSADVWFSVDFPGQTLRIGPPEAPLLNADRIRYFDNQLLIACGNTFDVRLSLGSGASSSARLWIEDTWIEVRGISTGAAVPEFGASAWAIMTIGVMLALLFTRFRFPSRPSSLRI